MNCDNGTAQLVTGLQPLLPICIYSPDINSSLLYRRINSHRKRAGSCPSISFILLFPFFVLLSASSGRFSFDAWETRTVLNKRKTLVFSFDRVCVHRKRGEPELSTLSVNNQEFSFFPFFPICFADESVRDLVEGCSVIKIPPVNVNMCRIPYRV